MARRNRTTTSSTSLELFGVTSMRTPGGTRVSARLGESRASARDIVFEISPEAGIEAVDRADAFFPIALLVAMRAGRALHVDAPLSPRLLYHANAYLQAIIHRIHPDHQLIEVTASQVQVPAAPDDRGVCTGLSCGVDSFSVLQDHWLTPTVEGFRLTHLLFNDVGSHRPNDREGVFQRRFARIRDVAQELGLPLIVTRSNQPDFLGNDFMSFDAVSNAAVPLLLQSRMARFYYGAAVTLEDLGVYPHNAVDMAEPALLPLLSTEAVELISTSAQYTRVEKIERLADLPLVQRHLDVCTVSPAHVVNCGRCTKCARMLFTLELLDKVEPFRHLFDLEAYWSVRRSFLVKMLYSRSMLMGQARDLVHERAYRVPPDVRLQAWVKHRLAKPLVPAAWRARFRGTTKRGGALPS